jgi:hypothetical protein
MILSDNMKEIFVNTAKILKGSDRRKYQAKVVQELGKRGQRFAEREFGWYRGTIRKGAIELESNIDFIDHFSDRGRKKIEVLLPNLLEDIKSIVEPASQIDPTFKTEQLYIRISANAVRKQLIKQKKYKENDLPTIRTINTKLNELGYKLKKVAKSKPKKKFRKQMQSLKNYKK